MTLSCLDLCSGMGTFGLVFKGQVKFVGYCDKEETCHKVLTSNMKKGLIDSAPIFPSLEGLSKDVIPAFPDMITAGFPCQDISIANVNGAGLDGDRSGAAFREIVRLAGELEVEHLFLENVAHIVRRGLDRISKTLADLGYAVSHTVISAKQCGAPHVRKRCFILATRNLEALKGIVLSPSNYWTNTRQPCTLQKPNKKNKVRSGLCGNGIVPQCAAHAFNALVHGTELPRQETTLSIKLVSDEDEVFYRKNWATPYAASWRYNHFRMASRRSVETLINQIYYLEGNREKRKAGKIEVNPRFVEWMMGLPPNFSNF